MLIHLFVMHGGLQKSPLLYSLDLFCFLHAPGPLRAHICLLKAALEGPNPSRNLDFQVSYFRIIGRIICLTEISRIGVARICNEYFPLHLLWVTPFGVCVAPKIFLLLDTR